MNIFQMSRRIPLHNPPEGSQHSQVPWLPPELPGGAQGWLVWGLKFGRWLLLDQGDEPRFCSLQPGVKISPTDVPGVIALHGIGKDGVCIFSFADFQSWR